MLSWAQILYGLAVTAVAETLLTVVVPRWRRLALIATVVVVAVLAVLSWQTWRPTRSACVLSAALTRTAKARSVGGTAADAPSCSESPRQHVGLSSALTADASLTPACAVCGSRTATWSRGRGLAVSAPPTAAGQASGGLWTVGRSSGPSDGGATPIDAPYTPRRLESSCRRPVLRPARCCVPTPTVWFRSFGASWREPLTSRLASGSSRHSPASSRPQSWW
jgi:hypothetical protein